MICAVTAHNTIFLLVCSVLQSIDFFSTVLHNVIYIVCSLHCITVCVVCWLLSSLTLYCIKCPVPHMHCMLIVGCVVWSGEQSCSEVGCNVMFALAPTCLIIQLFVIIIIKRIGFCKSMWNHHTVAATEQYNITFSSLWWHPLVPLCKCPKIWASQSHLCRSNVRTVPSQVPLHTGCPTLIFYVSHIWLPEKF